MVDDGWEQVVGGMACGSVTRVTPGFKSPPPMAEYLTGSDALGLWCPYIQSVCERDVIYGVLPLIGSTTPGQAGENPVHTLKPPSVQATNNEPAAIIPDQSHKDLTSGRVQRHDFGIYRVSG